MDYELVMSGVSIAPNPANAGQGLVITVVFTQQAVIAYLTDENNAVLMDENSAILTDEGV